jgi:dipeptide/tripeptide permease
MKANINQKVSLRDYSFNYWVVIIFEFFERGSYYGVMSVLSVYLTNELEFSKEGVGIIKSTIQPILYFLPILSGAIADRLGYRKTLLVAFSLLGLGYFLTAQATAYSIVFFFLVIMALGAGTFKPIISGTIAKLTDERTGTLGFGIFYWTINLGAFLVPTFLVPVLKSIDWTYVLVAAAIGTGAMIIPTLFIYKEPPREIIEKQKLGSIVIDIFKKVVTVFIDWRFILFIFIYSWFWILYFQMFDSVLWYFDTFIDTTPFNNLISGLVGINFKFDTEHITSVNALTIILLQLLVSAIVTRTKPLPTMITGIFIGTLGLVILSLSTNFWVFFVGIFTFSIGEMTAHPKYISYLGLIAPKDKKATYMGFGFLYGFFGSLIAGILGANLYVSMIDNPMIDFVKNKISAIGASAKLTSNATIKDVLGAAEQSGINKADVLANANTTEFWLVIASIGILCIIGLVLYNKFIGTRQAKDLK